MRLVTRGNFDSLISSVLLSLVHDIDEIKVIKPDVLIENRVSISSNDVVANLPYHPQCGYWYEHHKNEEERAKSLKFKGNYEFAPSCARSIFNCYNNMEEIQRFEKVVKIADKIDSANLSVEDIKNPHGWYILERTLHAFDPAGKLGNFIDYFENLVYWIKTYPLSQILLADEVQTRIEHVRSEHKIFVDALHECSYADENVIVTDSRKLRYFPNGNRFLIYTIFPNQNVSVSIFNKRETETSIIFVGHNIFNKTCKKDINTLLSKYKGSGRPTAGTCIVPISEADDILKNIITELKGRSA